jgi:hypothetical protein
MNTDINKDLRYIFNNLTNGRTVEFIYAPKNISKFYKRDFRKHPVYGYYNKFYLTKQNNRLSFLSENKKKVNSTAPQQDALNLFNQYYNNPDFSTMIALTDNRYNNLIFYNSDTGQFYVDNT